MPSAYTAKLVEKGQTFKQFALTCARAFGAMIDMRDDPLDAEIPRVIQPDSHYAGRAQAAAAELARLQGMTHEEKLAFGQNVIDSQINRCDQEIEKDAEANLRIGGMLARVLDWNPPSKEHVDLKRFMREQLEAAVSDSSYWHKEKARIKNKSPMAIYNDAVEAAKGHVGHYETLQAKETQRAATCTKWIQQLRKSLK